MSQKTLSPILDQSGQPFQHPRQPRTPRQVSARYDLAQTNAENRQRWGSADLLGPLSALDPGVRQLMRMRSRLEYENSPYYVGIIRTLANDTIGTGPCLHSLTGDRDADRQIQDAFWAWMTATKLCSKLRTMRIAKARDGEAFAVMVTNESNANPVKLDVMPVEADRVHDITYQRNFLTDGIELDRFGNPIAYNVLDQHPGDLFRLDSMPLHATRVLAEDMIHLFDCERPGQIRGVPELAASTQIFGKLRDFTASTMAAADTAARWSAVLQSQAGAGDPDDIEPLDNIELEPNTALTLPRGWSVSQIKQEHPSTTYEMFVRAKLQEAGRPASQPYSVTACDNSNSNYSSGRLDRKIGNKPIKIERFYWELTALDVILAHWWEEARRIPGLLPDGIGDLQAPTPHQWRWDGEEEVDAQKEISAAGDAISIGISSHEDECAKRGRDYAVVEAQNAAAFGMSVEDYRKRLADKMLGPEPTPPAPAQGNTADEPQPAEVD